MFNNLHKKNIPLILLNARITKKTFDRWKFFKKFASELFNSFTVCISSNKETVKACVSISDFEQDKYLVMSTKRGVVKKTKLDVYSSPRTYGIIAFNLKNDDELISVQTTSGKDQIIISTKIL